MVSPLWLSTSILLLIQASYIQHFALASSNLYPECCRTSQHDKQANVLHAPRVVSRSHSRPSCHYLDFPRSTFSQVSLHLLLPRLLRSVNCAAIFHTGRIFFLTSTSLLPQARSSLGQLSSTNLWESLLFHVHIFSVRPWMRMSNTSPLPSIGSSPSRSMVQFLPTFLSPWSTPYLTSPTKIFRSTNIVSLLPFAIFSTFHSWVRPLISYAHRAFLMMFWMMFWTSLPCRLDLYPHLPSSKDPTLKEGSQPDRGIELRSFSTGRCRSQPIDPELGQTKLRVCCTCSLGTIFSLPVAELTNSLFFLSRCILWRW